jgi:alpha/beta superfamily hydrolase
MRGPIFDPGTRRRGRNRDWIEEAMPEVMFAGPMAGSKAATTTPSSPIAPVALILHPHPLHGGTMNNRVVHALYQRFQAMGFSTLRFNFRGVGRSQGRYDGGIGEISDAAAALDFLQAVNPNASSLWVAGYSFGAYVGMQLLMRRPEMGGFVSVSAPASHYDFGFLAPCPCNGLILHGADDELVPESSVRKLVEKLNTQKGIRIDYRVMPGAGHIFTPPQAEQVADAAEDHVMTALNRNRMALAAD